MYPAPAELFTQRHPVTAKGRFIQFPLVRILICFMFLLPAIGLHNVVVIFLVEKLAKPWFEIGMAVMFAVDLSLMLLLYRLYTRRVEDRPAVETGGSGALREVGLGFCLAVLLVGACWLVILLFASYHVTGTDSPWILLYALVTFTSGAFVQRMLFTLILFRLTEEWLGTWIAFILTSVVFGLAHAVNGNLTPLAFMSLAVGDLVFVGAFVLTRRLWLVWGLHSGWNFLQDGLLGMPNSGVTDLPSWIKADISGPEWITGGSIGIEASLTALLLCTATGVILLARAAKRGRLVQVPATWSSVWKNRW